MVGRNPSNSWWYIQLPANSATRCWVSAQSAQIRGDILLVPVVSPPPKPTSPPAPTVLVTFANVHKCSGTLTATFRVENNGFVAIRSITISVVDLTNGNTLFGPVDKNAPFMEASDLCPWGGYNLPTGEVGYLGVRLPGAISTHLALADITLCTEKNQGGDCVQARVQFKIP